MENRVVTLGEAQKALNTYAEWAEVEKWLEEAKTTVKAFLTQNGQKLLENDKVYATVTSQSRVTYPVELIRQNVPAALLSQIEKKTEYQTLSIRRK